MMLTEDEAHALFLAKLATVPTQTQAAREMGLSPARVTDMKLRDAPLNLAAAHWLGLRRVVRYVER